MWKFIAPIKNISIFALAPLEKIEILHSQTQRSWRNQPYTMLCKTWEHKNPETTQIYWIYWLNTSFACSSCSLHDIAEQNHYTFTYFHWQQHSQTNHRARPFWKWKHEHVSYFRGKCVQICCICHAQSTLFNQNGIIGNRISRLTAVVRNQSLAFFSAGETFAFSRFWPFPRSLLETLIRKTLHSPNSR